MIAIENYNTKNFPLVGELSLTGRQNNFVYRLDKIRGVCVTGVNVRSDLKVGLTSGIDRKWLQPPHSPTAQPFCLQISHTRCESSGTINFSIASFTAPEEPGMQKIMVSL